MTYLKYFFLGILAAFFALVIEETVYVLVGSAADTEILLKISWMLMAAALIEEIFKYAIIYKSIVQSNSPREILLGSALVGLGFSAVEIILDYYNPSIAAANNPLPLLGVILIHVLTCLVAGILISQKRNFYATLLGTLVINTMLHLLYNLAVLNIF